MTHVSVTDLRNRAIKLAQNTVRVAISGARGPIGLDLIGDPADWTGKVPQFTGTGRQAVPVLPGSGADATLRADLLSTTGASNVKNRLSGTTGAVDQLVSDLFGEIIMPTRWGAKFDGSHDDTVAFAAAINDANDRSDGATIMLPSAGRGRLTDALPEIGDHVQIVGFGNAGSLLSIEHDGPAFTWTGYGGGLENLRITCPDGIDPAAAVAFIKGGNGQNFRNLRVDKIAKLIQMGDLTHRGDAIHATQIMGNCANVAAPLFDLYAAAGLIMSEVDVFVNGVGNPDVDRVSMMSSAEGRSFIKTNGFGVDSVLGANNIFPERFWRILDCTTTVGGGNILNVFFSATADYIADDGYHFESPASGAGIVDVILGGYISAWGGCGINIQADGPIRDIDILPMVFPFSGNEAIRVAGESWSEVRVHMPKSVAANRLDTGAADIRFQDSGLGHFSVLQARAGVNGAPGGTAWQGRVGISIGADLNNFTVADNDCGGEDEGYEFEDNSSPSGNRRIRDNIGADYSGFRTDGQFAMPASGVAWINKTGFEIEVTVCGGTVTSIQKNAHVVGVGQATFTLFPGDGMYLEYSAAPNAPMFYVKP